jgi:hypothetical protein
MIFFFWRGKGYIVFIGIVCTILLTALVAGALLGFEDATMPTYVIEFSIGSLLFVPIWFYGRKWNKEAYTFTHRTTGTEITIVNPHTAFGIPIQYWAIIWPLLLLLIFLMVG